MIESLSIERFKSIRSLTFQCSKVNVFIGPPDTGKTNILEALGLVSRLGWALPLDGALRIRPQSGFEPLFHRQFFDVPIRIRALRRAPGTHIKLELTMSGGADRRLTVGEEGAHPQSVGTLAFGQPLYMPHLSGVRLYSYADSGQWRYQQERVPDRARIIDPPHGLNLLAIAKHDSRVYDFLKELIGPGWRLKFDNAQETFVLSEVREDEIVDYNLDLLSDSVKRFFFYGSILLTTRDAELVLDEPDVYAFPPYPKKLGEMIAADDSNQFFLTTHNPYLLTSLAEKTPADQLGIFIASRDEQGATALTRLTPVQVSEVIEQGAAVFFNLSDFVPS